MKGYRINAEVNVHDVDYNGIARASSILKYMQSAAQSQLTENGMSYDSLYGRRRAFILSRIRLEINCPLRADMPLTAITFPCESRGYSFLRCYALELDGVPVARAISMWALINTESRELIRVNDFELGLSTLPPIDMTVNRFRMPDVMTEVGGYTVRYGDTDQNMHMNNTRYPDMYADFMPMKDRMVKAITINYMNEAPLGDTVRVMRGENNGMYYFRTVRGDGKVNSEAEVELCLL